MRIITSKTRRKLEEPPEWPFTINWDSDQSYGLQCWLPLGIPIGTGLTELDLAKGNRSFTVVGATRVPSQQGWCRSFNGSSDYIELASAIFTAVPLTITAWYHARQAETADLIIAGISRAATSVEGFWLTHGGSILDDNLRAQTANSTINSANATPPPRLGQWNLGVASFGPTTGTDRAASSNGLPFATNTTNRTPANLDRTTIGAAFTVAGTRGSFFNGMLRDLRFYDRQILDQAESYYLFDLRTRFELYYPLWRRSFFFPPAAAAATGKPWHYYYQQLSA